MERKKERFLEGESEKQVREGGRERGRERGKEGKMGEWIKERRKGER